MRFKTHIILLLTLWTIASCSSSNQEKENQTDNIAPVIIEDTIPKEEILYTWVNSLNVREEPNLKSKIIIKLKEGTKVKYQGNQAGEETTVTLRGKKITSKFKEITTKSGLRGWVFGGALKPLAQKLEANPNDPNIRLANKILTLEETNLGKLWLDELEIVQEEKLNRIFLKENLKFDFEEDQGTKYIALLDDQKQFEIEVVTDDKGNYLLHTLRITSPLIADRYGIYPDMTYEEIKKLRPHLTQNTTTEGKTMAYQRKSNIMYELCCPAGEGKTQYSENEIKDWQVKAIIWQQND